MKTILTLALSLILLNGISQNSRDVFAGRCIPPVNNETLKNARSISDIIPNCPTHWNEIIDIVSIKILTVCDGEARLSESKSGKMTRDQSAILSHADLGTEISIHIEFKWKDVNSAVAENGSIQKMNEFRLAVVPETEAQYPGGSKELKQYLENNISNKVPVPNKDKPFVPGATAMFTVNEDGGISDVKILSKPSSDPQVDKLLIDALNKMPKWKPALNAKGEKVKQEFKYGIHSATYKTGGC
jgi:hypothetical protein